MHLCPLHRLGRVLRIAPLLAILDQAVYALTNLALQVIVARSVSQEEFGAYSVGSTFFFVSALVHASFIIEPMFVFTAQRYGNCVGAYHKRLRREGSILFSITTVVVGLVLAGVMWIAGSFPVAKTLAAFAIVSPLLLYLWLLRRMAFLLGRIELAVLGGAVYSFSLFCGVALVSKFGEMTASAAVGLSGVAAVIGSVVVAGVISWTASETKPPKDMVYQHFRYGRWSASSEAVSLAISNGPIVVLPIWHGLVAAAQVRILNLIFMPVLQVVVPMAYLLLGRFASTVRQGEDAQKAVGFVRLLVAGAGAYSALVVALGGNLIALIFGQEHWVEERWLMLAAATTTCWAAAQGFFVPLRAREQSHLVLRVHLVVLVINVGLLPLLILLGVTGILLGQTIGWFAAVVVAAFMVSRLDMKVEPLAHAESVPRI